MSIFSKIFNRSTAQPLNRSTAQPLNRSTAQPLNRSTAQPLNRSTAQPLNRSTAQPLNRSTAQPLNRSTAQPLNRSAAQPLSRSAAQPLSRSAAQPLSRSAAQPLSRSAAQPLSRSAAQPLSRSAAQPLSRSTAQPLNRSTAQPLSRSAAQPLSRSAALTSFAFALLLTACSGSSPDLSTGIASTTKSVNFGQPASAEAVTALSNELVSYFNGQHVNNPQALMGAQAKASTRKSATAMIAASNVANPVFRFYNVNTGAHFFTMSTAERDYVKNTFPFFVFEGNSFFAYPDADPSLSPVYRFYNKVTGTHFFTISAEEKAYVQATWPDIFNFEGISWYASADVRAGWVPVYRFFNTKTSTHFYTTSAAERDYVQATWSWFTFEGIAYYVREYGNFTCTPDPIGTTGYSLVFKACSAPNVAVYYDKTECVRDNATGLIWQGHTPAGTGLRAIREFKTNLDSTTELQIWLGTQSGSNGADIDFRVPTLAEINAPTNSIGFKNLINASNLCGASNWRMPTRDELWGIKKLNVSPNIDLDWFPNTGTYTYHSSTPNLTDQYHIGHPSTADSVDFNVNYLDYGSAYRYDTSFKPSWYNGWFGHNFVHVRLVR